MTAARTMNLAALRAAGAALEQRASTELDPECDALRRALCPAYARERDREDAYARRSGRVDVRKLNPADAATAPVCGDCRALRSPLEHEPCASCGSTQPPDLSRMNPRAARLIGQGAYR